MRTGPLGLLLFYSGLGWLVVWVPWRLAVAAGTSRATNPVDGLNLVSLPLLVAVGALGGLLAPRRTPWLALGSMAAFPVIAVADMLRDPTSHNLWPFEFFFYALEALLAVGGAAGARNLRLRRAA